MSTAKFKNLLQSLISSPSVSSTVPSLDMGNRGVCERLAEYLEPLGFRCEMQAVSGNNKFNLIATRGRGEDGLVLSGHADIVPFDEQGWDSDPFAVTTVDNRWHGLGTCDMKGFLALCVLLAEEIKDDKLTRPLTILATADEESGMDGIKALQASQRRLGRYALIGEPTGLKPIRMHKGIFMDAVSIHGHAGHSSNPHLGVNAVEGVHAALGALLQLRDELRNGQHNPGFSVPYATLNPGCIHGGDSPNRIPAQCQLQFDLRPLPGMSLQALREQAREKIDSALSGHNWRWQHEVLFDGAEPFETPASAAIVQAVERLTGSQAEAVNFATEGGYLNQMGMQSVVLGPGSIDQAHQPNEYLEMNQIEPMMDILRGLVNTFCHDG